VPGMLTLILAFGSDGCMTSILRLGKCRKGDGYRGMATGRGEPKIDPQKLLRKPNRT